MPGHLAGTISILGQHARYVVLPSFSGRQVVVVLIFLAVVICLLIGPVLGENLFDIASTKGAKAAPATFFLGLGVLLLGLFLGVPILDGVGACLIGAVLLGVILVNY